MTTPEATNFDRDELEKVLELLGPVAYTVAAMRLFNMLERLLDNDKEANAFEVVGKAHRR